MKANLYLIIATSLWGLNFHFARLLLKEVDFIEGGFWRYGLAALTLVIINIKSLPKLDTVKKNLKGILMVGGIGLFGFNLFFFLGLQKTTGVNGALIMGLNPAITLIFSSLILKTQIKKNHITGIIIALLGVSFLLLKGNIHNIQSIVFNPGDLLVLTAVIFFALHHVWVKKYSNASIKNQEFTLLTALTCAWCFIFVLPFNDFQPLTNHSSLFWLGAVGIGCIGTGFSYLLWNNGVKKIGAHKAGIFVNLVPLSAGISASLFGEKLYFFHLISGLLIITGLVIMQVSRKTLHE